MEGRQGRESIYQTPMYGSLIYTVTYVSDRLFTQASSNPRLPPSPELRRVMWGSYMGERCPTIHERGRGLGVMERHALRVQRRDPLLRE